MVVEQCGGGDPPPCGRGAVWWWESQPNLALETSTSDLHKPGYLLAHNHRKIILLAMPCYRYIIKAWSPRDGGWVRLCGYFKTEQDAWDLIDVLIPLLQLHGDIEGFNVVRTIRF